MKWFIFLIASLFSFGLLADKKYQTGLIIPKDWKSKAKFESSIKRGFAAPAEFDWRTQKTLSPIMDQGQCGSCWDFSASATFRDDMIVQGGSLFKNSTQEVLDCTQYSCQGGFFDVGEFFVSPGVATESAYGPYQAKKNSCRQVQKSSKAVGWAYVALSDSSRPSDSEIKAAIYRWGPVSVGVAADNAFSGYSGGVFTNCTSNQLNHAVQLVGWSDSGGYWIMRNSWGSSWGESGYMRLKFGCNGIGEAANYFKFDSNPVPPSPTPTPDPTPGPTPNPDPTPVPPGPSPCDLPKASTRYPAQVKATKGRIYTVGTKAVVGETYLWTAVPAFNNNAMPTDAVIGYKPAYTKTITITATNSCGKASASTTFNIPTSKGMEVFD